MKKNLLLILAVALLLAFIGCEKNSSSSVTKKSGDWEKELSPIGKDKKKEGVHLWPPEPDQNIELANNKLASNYYIVFDGSGSMAEAECGTGSKIDSAKKAVKDFVTSLPADANIALLVFDNFDFSERVPFHVKKRSTLISQIDAVYAGEGTPLSKSLEKAYLAIKLQAQKQQGYGEYHLIVITDGESGDGDPGKNAKFIADVSTIQMHVIGFCVGDDHSLNIKGVTNYSTAQNPAELKKGLQKVLAESKEFDIKSFQGIK